MNTGCRKLLSYPSATQEAVLAGSRKLCANIVCLTVLAFVPVAIFAQGKSSTNDGGDAANFLIHEAKAYSLTGPDIKPWRMKISFRLLDAQGNTTDQGTFEELWVNQFRSCVFGKPA